MGGKEILNDDEGYLIASNKMKTPATRGEALRGWSLFEVSVYIFGVLR